MSEKANTRDMKDSEEQKRLWQHMLEYLDISYRPGSLDLALKAMQKFDIGNKGELSSRDSEIAKLTSERDEAVKLLRSIIELDESYLESGKAFDDIKSFLSKTPKP